MRAWSGEASAPLCDAAGATSSRVVIGAAATPTLTFQTVSPCDQVIADVALSLAWVINALADSGVCDCDLWLKYARGVQCWYDALWIARLWGIQTINEVEEGHTPPL